MALTKDVALKQAHSYGLRVREASGLQAHMLKSEYVQWRKHASNATGFSTDTLDRIYLRGLMGEEK